MSTQPGWYPDPTQPGQVRYFDGSAWTQHTQSHPVAAAAPQAYPPAGAPAPVPQGAMPTAAVPTVPQPVAMHHPAPVVAPTFHNSVVIANTAPQKSVGVALLLTFLFGPFGLLYVTIAGGIVMIVLNVVLGVLTFGIANLVLWPIEMVWAAVAASNANKQSAIAMTSVQGGAGYAPTAYAPTAYAQAPQYPQQQYPQYQPGPAQPQGWQVPPAGELPQQTGPADPFAAGVIPTTGQPVEHRRN